MRVSIRSNMNGTNLELILLIAFILGILAGRAHAQNPGGGIGGLYIGIEATNSGRSFAISSDLQDLKGIKVIQSGRTYGVTLGSRLISGKLRIGNFETSKGDGKPIKSSSIELGSSFSPLQLVAKRAPILEPYVTVSIETTKINTDGTYTPPAAKPASTCSCQCPSSSPSAADPDPSANTPVTNKPVPFAGSFGSTRANAGVGLKAHVQKGKLFLTVFGEMKYGLTLGTTASTPALLNTYVLNQTGYSAGVSLGFIYTKSGHRLRKVSFR